MIRTFPLLRFSKLCPEDLDTDGEDHVADEVRYLCMMSPEIKPPQASVKNIPDNPLDLNF